MNRKILHLIKYIDKNQPKTTGERIVGIYCNVNFFVNEASGTGTGPDIIIAGTMTLNSTCAGGPSNMAGLPAHLVGTEYDVAGKSTDVSTPMPGIT